MADHWKSTNKYWCKFCSDFIKDTKYDRKVHEASTKHQNGIQRSLREIHKAKSQEDRDKQRAKDEVARINGVVSGKRSDSGIQGATDVNSAGTPKGYERKATPAERRAQMEQLVAMGIKLPGEAKKEVTGVSDWQVVSQKTVETPVYNDDEGMKEEQDSKDGIKESSTSTGVRKRRAEEDEEDVRDEEVMSKRRQQVDWGSKFLSYPVGRKQQVDEDLEALLTGVGDQSVASGEKGGIKDEGVKDEGIKDEEVEEKPLVEVPDYDAATQGIKREESTPAPSAVVFKKRKSKR